MLTIRRSQAAAVAPRSGVGGPEPKTSSEKRGPAENGRPPSVNQDRWLAIRPMQLETLRTESVELFHEATIGMIRRDRPAWSNGKSEAEIRKFVREMTEVARQNLLVTAGAVQMFMLYKIDHNFPIPLSDYHASVLRKKSLDEDYRMNRFHLSLTGGQKLIPITLTSTLSTKPRQGHIEN